MVNNSTNINKTEQLPLFNYTILINQINFFSNIARWSDSEMFQISQ